jgi:hypothetical protein
MENVTSDSNKTLSEKLALTREMSSLRPEVEHLRAQVESNQGLLAEKLSLQRQLTTLQVELENEKRSSARAMAKQGKKVEQDEELLVEMEGLRKELAKEKKDRLKVETSLAKVEKAAEKAQADLESQERATERMQAKLDKSNKKESGKASKVDQERDAELQELRDELEQEKVARKKAEKTNKKGHQQSDAQVDELNKQLDEERRQSKQQEKESQKALAEQHGRITVLEDKLNQFREKLRTTKEKLKVKETELERAQSAAPTTKPSRELSKPAKNARKRMAATAEPDMINLGTPGEGFPAKRAKRATAVSAVGDTSTFSLTPFLNKKSNVAPASPIVEEDEEAGAGAEAEATPTAPPKRASKKIAQPKIKPLAPSASNKANANRKRNPTPVLEMVTEESEHSTTKESSENPPMTTTIPLKDADDGPSKDKSLVPKIKPRKSLMSFATFTEEPAAEKKKKRKLGASASSGLGKTLFDADEDVLPAKPVGGKGIFAARALAKNVLGKAKGPVRPISGGYNMMSEENFTFSPLKKDRKTSTLWQN